jgi:hypothetical protein
MSPDMGSKFVWRKKMFDKFLLLVLLVIVLVVGGVLLDVNLQAHAGIQIPVTNPQSESQESAIKFEDGTELITQVQILNQKVTNWSRTMVCFNGNKVYWHGGQNIVISADGFYQRMSISAAYKFGNTILYFTNEGPFVKNSGCKN